jgi:hypothetical protein
MKYLSFTMAELDLAYKCADSGSQPRQEIGLEIARRCNAKNKVAE